VLFVLKIMNTYSRFLCLRRT